MLPAGQVYTYDGIGDNDSFPRPPEASSTPPRNSPLLEELMQVWLGRKPIRPPSSNLFFRSSTVSLTTPWVYANDLDASIRWIALMTRFQPKIDITLHYVSTTSVSSTRSLWADFPAFLRLVKLAYRYDMLLTVKRSLRKKPSSCGCEL